MPKIKKLPSGNYNARVYDKILGKTTSITAPTREEVKRLAARYELEVKKHAAGDYTIAEAIDSYIKSKSNVLSPATLCTYEGNQRNAYNAINAMSAAAITSAQLQKYVNDFAALHSPKTTRDVYGLLSASIRQLYPDKAFSVTLPQKKPTERHIPTDNDIREMIACANHNLKIAILLAATGTLRRGEVCALTYGDIKDDTVHVHRNMVKKPGGGFVIKDTPKTSSSDRYIPLPAEVIAQLGSGDPEDRICTASPNTITNEFSKLRDKLHLSCRFHDLRHYAASIMHAIGVPDAYIMKRGGWSSDAVLKSVYRNALDDKEKEFVNMANEYLSKAIL